VLEVSTGDGRRGARDEALAARVKDAGFTPSARDLDALVDLLADDTAAPSVERAIARIGPAAATALRRRMADAVPRVRGRIVRAVARLGRESQARGRPCDECAAILLEALGDGDPKTRRNAAIGLGQVPAAGAEDALLDAWTRDPRPEMRRSIAGALGKMASARALPLLRDAARADDAELVRIAERAAMMIERTASRDRGDAGRVDGSKPAPHPVEVQALVRSGLEDLLLEELAAIPDARNARFDAPGRVSLTLRGPPDGLFAARTMLSFEFPLPPEPVRGEADLPDAIARALSKDAARTVLETWTAGPVRYRIAWSDRAHRRAATWNTAKAIARRAQALTNDPTRSTWEVLVTIRGAQIEVALVPRALPDPRFTWRAGDVPAASHPTIAAALAQVAGVRADDVVWDPFTGSGAELVERALRGPYRSLLGSDVDERALAVARKNLDGVGLTARLERADALTLAPDGVTLVVTNPPMGRRAARVAGLSDFLDAFVAHVARVLAPAGRLVWIAPWPNRTRTTAERAGLRLEWARSVDMGGFGAEMQRWVKPGGR
jgi:23S rRNA G2445 N2-methylase RlmL